jgi:hypothetical protein
MSDAQTQVAEPEADPQDGQSWPEAEPRDGQSWHEAIPPAGDGLDGLIGPPDPGKKAPEPEKKAPEPKKEPQMASDKALEDAVAFAAAGNAPEPAPKAPEPAKKAPEPLDGGNSAYKSYLDGRPKQPGPDAKPAEWKRHKAAAKKWREGLESALKDAEKSAADAMERVSEAEKAQLEASSFKTELEKSREAQQQARERAEKLERDYAERYSAKVDPMTDEAYLKADAGVAAAFAAVPLRSGDGTTLQRFSDARKSGMGDLQDQAIGAYLRSHGESDSPGMDAALTMLMQTVGLTEDQAMRDHALRQQFENGLQHASGALVEKYNRVKELEASAFDVVGERISKKRDQFVGLMNSEANQNLRKALEAQSPEYAAGLDAEIASNARLMAHLDVVAPPLAEGQDIAEHVAQHQARIAEMAKIVEALPRYRAAEALLPKYLERIRDLEGRLDAQAPAENAAVGQVGDGVESTIGDDDPGAWAR